MSGVLPPSKWPKLSADDKTRLEGVEGLVKTVATQNPVVSNVNNALDTVENLEKIIDPVGARRSSALKKIQNL